MSISKVSLGNLNQNVGSRTKPKWTSLANTFLLSVFLLSTLDLLLAYVRGDSLGNYTRSVLVDLTLTVFGLIFCSDLIKKQDQESIICFLAYLLFLWICITLLKLVFLL